MYKPADMLCEASKCLLAHRDDVPADQIYRTRDNRTYCKKQRIRLSGPKLGRPSQDAGTDKK